MHSWLGRIGRGALSRSCGGPRSVESQRASERRLPAKLADVLVDAEYSGKFGKYRGKTASLSHAVAVHIQLGEGESRG